MVYFDMDGVLTNLDEAYANKWGCHIKNNHSKSLFWKNIGTDKDFFRKLPWIPGMQEVVNTSINLFGIDNVGICSSFGSQKETWRQKMEWLDNHPITRQIPLHNRILVPSKSYKKRYRQFWWDILVDDREDNINDWNSVFSFNEIGILFKHPGMTATDLQNKLCEYMPLYSTRLQ